MNQKRTLVGGLLLAALVLALVAPVSGNAASAQAPLSRVRFLHAVPGAPAVDVYVDGTLAAAGLSFGAVTPHLNVAGGDHRVALRPSGAAPDAAPLLEVAVPLVPNLAFTVIAQGSPAAVEAALYEDILDEIGVGFARLTAINAIADAPPLDVVTTEGGPLLQGVSYGAQFGTVNIGTGVQNLVMVPAGGAVESAIATIGEVPLRSGVLYTFVALGQIQGAVAPAALVIATPVNGAAGSVLVQVAHGSADAPAVDVYAGDTLIIPKLAPGELSGHIAVPAGDYTLALRPAGTPAADAPALSAEVSLTADVPALTVAALGLLGDGTLGLQVFPDDVAGLGSDQARFSVINAVSGAAVDVSLPDTTVLVSALGAGAESGVINTAPGKMMLLVRVSAGDAPLDLVVPEAAYNGGTFYTVLVYGGGALPVNATIAGTPVNVVPGSLPAAVSMAMAASTEQLPGAGDAQTAPAVTDQGGDASSAPGSDAGGQPATVLQPVAPASSNDGQANAASEGAGQATELVGTANTEAPSGGEMAAQPAATTPAPLQPQQPLPVAYVELNPGANLHCRELPGSDKRSLALIPSGTALNVNGRAGTPLVPETGNPTPEPTPVMEQVEDIWLSVRWDTPDGGYLRCWVNAGFLRIEFRGQLLDTVEELMALPEEPFNRPGENVGSTVPPPTPRYDAVIATVQLQPGVSLQLRRYPNSNAESLALVPAQAQLEALGYAVAPSEGLVGQPTDPNWVYVRYRTENGGATIGWVSAQYVTLSRLGRAYALEDLALIDIDEAGYFEAPGQGPVIPAELQEVIGTVNLNPGANLNLRDRPSVDARVVLGIPSGESMVLLGRNGDGSWLRARYSSATGDLEGWVAAQFLIVTRGGQLYDVGKLPILTDEPDTFGAATPAAPAAETPTN